MWDARKLKLPVKVFDGLPAARQASVCFSPDESLIVTGVHRGPTLHSHCHTWGPFLPSRTALQLYSHHSHHYYDLSSLLELLGLVLLGLMQAGTAHVPGSFSLQRHTQSLKPSPPEKHSSH